MCNWPLAGLLLGLLASVLLYCTVPTWKWLRSRDSIQGPPSGPPGTDAATLALHVVIILFRTFIEHSMSMHPLSPSTHHYRSITDTRAPPRYIHTALVLALLFTIYAFFLSAYVLGPPRLGLPLRIY